VTDFAYIAENLARVRQKIAALARATGQPEATLLVVTKKATDEQLAALLALGVEAIGENYPQAFARRYELLPSLLSGASASSEVPTLPAMHLIGSLQTNKVKYVVGRAALIQSVDRLRLAEELQRQSERQAVITPILLEVNSGAERDKGGVLPEETEALHAQLSRLSHLRIEGLMTMGPVCRNPEDYRPYFALTRELFERIRSRGGFPVPHPILSMGMSGSYEVAIEEGATLVRVGSEIFRQEPSR